MKNSATLEAQIGVINKLDRVIDAMDALTQNSGIAYGEYDAVLSDTVELAKAGWIQPTLLGGTIKYVTVKGETRTRIFEKGEVSVVKVRQVFSTGTTANLGIVVYYE